MKKILSSSILLTAVLGTMIFSASNVMASNTDNSNSIKNNETQTNLNIDNKDQYTNSLFDKQKDNKNVKQTYNKHDLTLDYVPNSFSFNSTKINNSDNGSFLFKNTTNKQNPDNSHYVQVSDYRPENNAGWNLSAKLSTLSNTNSNSSLKVKDITFKSPFTKQRVGLDKDDHIYYDKDGAGVKLTTNNQISVMNSQLIKKNEEANKDTTTLLEGFQQITMESERKSGNYTGNITWTLNPTLNDQ